MKKTAEDFDMKKNIFSRMLLALAFIGVASFLPALPAAGVQLEGNPPPYISRLGGSFASDGYTFFAGFPGATGGGGIICIPDFVSITAGQLVAISGQVTYPNSVTLTTTVGDVKCLGVAISTAAINAPVQVVTAPGSMVRCASSVNVTFGDYLVSGGTAGKLTEPASSLAATYTGLSQTAFICRAMETRTITAANPYVLVMLLQ